MPGHDPTPPAGATAPRRAFYFTGGFLTNRRVRRILALAGHDLRLGKPGPQDDVLVWGHSPYAARGEKAARATGAHLVRVEDAFLRSLHPGRDGEPPLGLTIDRRGAWFDSRQPSDLEHLLATHPLDDTALLDRARDVIARLREGHLTKYAAVDPALPAPRPGYVLVIDQTRGDASIRLGGATDATFREMLVLAQEENPGARIVVKTHPETAGGHRAGHFGPEHGSDRITLCTEPLSPWTLMEGAVGVYTVSSQLGFEAILAGHKPKVFGQPFYAGWSLTDDRNPVARRTRRLTRAQLVAAALILYPRWYDSYRDRLCGVEDVLASLEARARTWREDRHGYSALGMRAWKKAPLQKVFGQAGQPLRFARTTAAALAHDRPVMVWAGKETSELRETCDRAGRALIRVEDGFLRSRGLGANLIPPLSLVLDDLGIYYDPTRPSRLEHLIAQAAALPPERLSRADRLIAALRDTRVGKYNLGGATDLPDPGGRPVVLVPGQVEDDASIRLGAGAIRTNLDLLRQARVLTPDAFLVYKPHPDVEVGLRPGAIEAEDLAGLANHVADHADPMALLDRADRVVTMTSLLGFEALLRGVPVTVTGAPFYAGWGLTDDIGQTPARRHARPSLPALVHATLIRYPRYHDPVTGQACPVEVAVERLASGQIPAPAVRLRALAKLQGWFAGHAWLWR
ncbi:capsular polysaccharide biosynthesis protein [Nioella nitratireducens]|uniref:capsular polysaccharide biosynthesis protein n=1 Tax=Nioella nitratireducens TaxID=1287720 RepID=UPI0008FD4531|nr:capsular polysaccharide biosynthesis protein [Nioella nitratireducens]